MSQDIGQKWIVKDRGYNEISVEAEECFNAICFFNDSNSIDKNKENANHIVKCVNSHEKMKNLLEECLEVMTYYKHKAGYNVSGLIEDIEKTLKETKADSNV